MLIRKFTTWHWLIAVVSGAALAGCGKVDPPPFRLNMTYVLSKQISDDNQQAIADLLGAMFGTPDHPFAMPETGLSQSKLDMAAGPVWSDEAGGKHGLYRRHCAHCHGISGDGHGPTALIVNPYPRDYRPGVFKFKSTYTAAQPTEADLARIVHDGAPGTAMPSFALLPPDEQRALVEYVKYLSIRGQTEKAVEDIVGDMNAGDKFDPTNAEIRKVVIDDVLKPIVEAWQGAKEQVIVPEEAAVPHDNRTPQQLAQSVDEGRKLFYGAQANCVKCHGTTALGDGQQDDFDDWTKANLEFIKGTDAKLAEIQSLKDERAKAKGDDAKRLDDQIAAARKDFDQRKELIATLLPARHAIPRNLRIGIMRGGHRPIDLFWRISAGIRGMPMPAVGPPGPGQKGTLTEQQIWQIVDYVQSLPFEPASQPQIKGAVNESAIATGE
jgi:mono/diheme cytochrome c family protein